MKTWLTSLDAAVSLSLLALLTVLGRTLLDYRYVIAEEYTSAGLGLVALGTLAAMALFGAWFWALLAAGRGSRTGLTVALGFSLVLAAGFGLVSVLVLCPPPCRTAWPLMEIADWSNLVTGAAATVVGAFYLRGVRSHVGIEERPDAPTHR